MTHGGGRTFSQIGRSLAHTVLECSFGGKGSVTEFINELMNEVGVCRFKKKEVNHANI